MANRIELLIQEYKNPVNVRKFIDRKNHSYSVGRTLRQLKKVSGVLPSIDYELPEDTDPLVAAKACFELNGIYPISFSSPRARLFDSINKDSVLSSIIPGKPYKYHEEMEYRKEYERAYWGITHKKGGWDCMRHLEILSSSCLPLMYDAKKIPKWTMNYYPKNSMRFLNDKFLEKPFIPGEATRTYFEAWFDTWLTPEAMVNNMFKLIGNKSKLKKILFIDDSLHSQIDYLSILTLVGLTRVAGVNLDIWEYYPEYLSENYSGKTGELYGRGFSFSKSISKKPHVISKSEVIPHEYDYVVIGGALQNKDSLSKYIKLFSGKRVILLLGNDQSSDKQTQEWLRNIGANVFQREII